MNTLIIPVHIEYADPHLLAVRPQNDMDDCPKCARGEGCGARPWFRGLFKNRAALRLPQSVPLLQSGDSAELHLPARILNILTALTYGVPLLMFLAGLLASRPLPEILQLAIALALAAASHIPARRYGERLLLRHLVLQARRPQTPRRCP